jgi:hypothetical protein
MFTLANVRIAFLTVCILVSGCLSGCGNTLYFMEGTKTALAVEVSASSPEPVALTAGYKRTIATLVPPREGDTAGANRNAKGEALSLISRFQLKYDQDDDVRLENLFVTGAAARVIGSSVEATNALMVSSTFSNEHTQEVITCWLKEDETNSRQAAFQQWVQDYGLIVSATMVHYGTKYQGVRETAIQELDINCAEDG